MQKGGVSFGLVGFGAWGKLHAQTISSCQGALLTAITAPSAASQAEARRLFPDVQVFSDHRAMLASATVDLVDVVTPSHRHFEIASDALNAGKHVLLEKPMALTLEHCQTLNALAASKQRMLAVGHELRLSSQWGEVKRLIEVGTIGTPEYVLVELSRKPYRLGADGWRYDEERVGSWALEEPIHFFDLARWYLAGHGEPKTVYATGNSCDPTRPGLHDNFSAILRYGSGAYAVISQTLAAFEHHQTVKIAGTKGALWAGWSGAADRTLEPSCFLKVFSEGRLSEVELEAQSGEVFELRKEIDMCVRCVSDGTPPAATGLDGLWSVRLCLAAEESLRKGENVDVEHFSPLPHS